MDENKMYKVEFVLWEEIDGEYSEDPEPRLWMYDIDNKDDAIAIGRELVELYRSGFGEEEYSDIKTVEYSDHIEIVTSRTLKYESDGIRVMVA